MADFDPNIPIYLQIMNILKQDIVSGTLSQGDRLVSVRDYAEKLSVNPNTVQRAYQELEREGITETRRGMGSYISDNPDLIRALKSEMARDITNTFLDGMRHLGFSHEEILTELRKTIKGGRR
ncbi:GntR family transcriptional regulator [Breznakiella homolactica]|uniref:GntR family transcriptional regulator n=1 Tax=Breznakiella homolactica TaxID=2798577 RepID=A0A7T8B9D7_9SPIR|nr:GntR family transcriptional regulator [Breznakiella homolactica]QQO08357.1 GntR family transcriptional regulator [Breznakiella homolactica]